MTLPSVNINLLMLYTEREGGIATMRAAKGAKRSLSPSEQFLPPTPPPPPRRGKEWPRTERGERREKSTEDRSVAKRTKSQRQRKRNSMAIGKIPDLIRIRCI